MYEPRVLRIKKPHSLAGTPAGKVNVIVNFLFTIIPSASLFWLSHLVINKRRIIDELEGTYYIKPELIPDDELKMTKDFWAKKELTRVIAEVKRRQNLKAKEVEETTSYEISK